LRKWFSTLSSYIYIYTRKGWEITFSSTLVVRKGIQTRFWFSVDKEGSWCPLFHFYARYSWAAVSLVIGDKRRSISFGFLNKTEGEKRHLELSNHAINVQVLDGLLTVEALRVFVLWLKNKFYKQDLINSSDCLRKRLDGSKTCRSLTSHEPKIQTYGIY